jgi:hypothetical protein
MPKQTPSKIGIERSPLYGTSLSEHYATRVIDILPALTREAFSLYFGKRQDSLAD